MHRIIFIVRKSFQIIKNNPKHDEDGKTNDKLSRLDREIIESCTNQDQKHLIGFKTNKEIRNKKIK
jgi:hypothetical protein